MANSNINLSSLDFDTLKNNYKEYLSTQSIFKDYNFEGSNISVLLDVMTYNSYLNSFYLNMVASEMFLDSAQKYDSVVSHAKELNYIPRSSKSAVANVSLTLTTSGITPPLSIPKGTSFTGINSNGTFTFTTNQLHTYTSPTNVYAIPNLQLFEGTYFKDSFIVNHSDETQRFLLSNKNVDLDSLTVSVIENNSPIGVPFTKVDTLFGLNNSSNVYFIQAAQNYQYEILFGDGFLGRVPLNQSIVQAEYKVTSGTDADGASSFVINTDLGVVNKGIVSVTNLTVNEKATGSSNSELIESIRFSAPRYFATQQRAVASDDYSSLILAKFGGQISDINVYGGESLEPKQYGKVVIALKPSGGTVAPDYVKNQISNYMLDYVSLPTRILIKDPEYLYCSVSSVIQYDKNLTTKLPNDISSIVTSTILNFSQTNLEKFGNDFRYSKFVAAIDNSDVSITSNNTKIKIVKRISPLLNYPVSIDIDFNNPAYSEDDIVLSSSPFTFKNYPLSYLQDDTNGNVVIYTYVNNIYTVLHDSVGTIDYSTGVIKLNKFEVSDYNNYISIYLIPSEKDIIVNKSKILILDSNDINLTVTGTVR
jgi:hypothetical protein